MSYLSAKERYAGLGIDTDRAPERLQQMLRYEEDVLAKRI